MEMLVALVVVAIGLSAAVLAFQPDPRRPLALEAERLALLLEQARDESMMSGTALGWQWHEGGYRFLRRELTDGGSQWLAMPRDEIFRPRELPAGMRVYQVQADRLALGPGEPVSLGPDGVQHLALELALEDARALVSSRADSPGFEYRLAGD